MSLILITLPLMSLLEAWDQQQETYNAAREERFEALLTVVEWHAMSSGCPDPVVVDLGAGPAAIGQRLLRRFPFATYVGVDIDPVLIHLARQVADQFDPGRVRMIECDAADPAWLDHVLTGGVDVVCSSTALHWLSEDELSQALLNAHRALRVGGLVLNADHLGYERAPTLTAVAEWIAARDAETAAGSGAPTWDQWWERARADAGLDSLCAARDRVFDAQAPGDNGGPQSTAADQRPTLRGFCDLVRRAGFSEVDTVWQRFDDRVVMAVKSAPSNP